VADAQSGHEKTLTSLLPALAGANLIYGLGMLESGVTIDYAQLVMDAEFARMVEFGMTPAQAIKSATSVPAVMLGMEGQIGVVAPGAFADIIAVQGDPLRDGNALKNIVFVVKDGKVFKNELR